MRRSRFCAPLAQRTCPVCLSSAWTIPLQDPMKSTLPTTVGECATHPPLSNRHRMRPLPGAVSVLCMARAATSGRIIRKAKPESNHSDQLPTDVGRCRRLGNDADLRRLSVTCTSCSSGWDCVKLRETRANLNSDPTPRNSRKCTNSTLVLTRLR